VGVGDVGQVDRAAAAAAGPAGQVGAADQVADAVVAIALGRGAGDAEQAVERVVAEALAGKACRAVAAAGQVADFVEDEGGVLQRIAGARADARRATQRVVAAVDGGGRRLRGDRVLVELAIGIALRGAPVRGDRAGVGVVFLDGRGLRAAVVAVAQLQRVARWVADRISDDARAAEGIVERVLVEDVGGCQ
jgi:hypothetical protein